jgi:hypothetical protein
MAKPDIHMGISPDIIDSQRAFATLKGSRFLQFAHELEETRRDLTIDRVNWNKDGICINTAESDPSKALNLPLTGVRGVPNSAGLIIKWPEITSVKQKESLFIVHREFRVIIIDALSSGNIRITGEDTTILTEEVRKKYPGEEQRLLEHYLAHPGVITFAVPQVRSVQQGIPLL